MLRAPTKQDLIDNLGDGVIGISEDMIESFIEKKKIKVTNDVTQMVSRNLHSKMVGNAMNDIEMGSGQFSNMKEDIHNVLEDADTDDISLGIQDSHSSTGEFSST